MTGDIRLSIRVIDRATPELRSIIWRLWWCEWGTEGRARRRSLVVVPDRARLEVDYDLLFGPVFRPSWLPEVLQHVLSVALDERIKARIRYRKWYRAERVKGWPKPDAAMLNDAALIELLALRRTARRVGR